MLQTLCHIVRRYGPGGYEVIGRQFRQNQTALARRVRMDGASLVESTGNSKIFNPRAGPWAGLEGTNVACVGIEARKLLREIRND